MFSFTINTDHCPECQLDLEQTNSVVVDGHPAYVEFDSWRVLENEDTDLILDNPKPEAICSKCGYHLVTEAVEEV